MAVFRPKIGQFSKFFKILSEIDKTHRNTLLVQKSFLAILWPFKGPFWANFPYTGCAKKNRPPLLFWKLDGQKLLIQIYIACLVDSGYFQQFKTFYCLSASYMTKIIGHCIKWVPKMGVGFFVFFTSFLINNWRYKNRWCMEWTVPENHKCCNRPMKRSSYKMCWSRWGAH